MQQSQSLPKPSDRWIPWYIAGFFLLLVIVLVPMCIIAVRTNSGLVTENAYEKGLAYNRAIEAGRQQELLKWKGNLSATRSPDGQTKVDLIIIDKTGKALEAADVKIHFVRPLKAGMDQSATMQPLESGHYKGTLLLPTGGLWDATASVTSNGNNFQILKRFVLP